MDQELKSYFIEYRKERAAKRRLNRELSAKRLTEAGIEFVSHNNGTHLIIELDHERIDFWPSTGKWWLREKGKQEPVYDARGVMELIKYVKLNQRG